MTVDLFGDLIRTWSGVLSDGANSDDDQFYSLFTNFVHETAEAGLLGHVPKTDLVDRLVNMATAYGFTNRFGADDLQELLAREISDIEASIEYVPDIEKPRSNGQYAKQAPPIKQPYPFPDAADIPRRSWLYATHYIRGYVVATVAPGGFGKTTLALSESLNMAMQGERVWYISGEDDMAELDRRIAAHCLNGKDADGAATPFTKADFGNRFFVDDKMSFPFKIGKSGRNGPEFDNAKLEALEQSIATNKIDVIILDPFVSFHLFAENDTAAMDLLVKRLGEICARKKCCIELAHHVRKPGFGQAEITVYDARGAAAIVNAVRSCRVLNQMSLNEAQQLKTPIEKRASYIRIDSGKRNMAPPEKAKWMHLISKQLANGDFVQALEPFEYKPQETTELDEAWVMSVFADGKSYRADSRSPEWFGIIVAEHFNRGHNEKGDVIWINKQIGKWLAPALPRRKKPLIRKIKREDEHRHEKVYYELVGEE